MSKWYVTGEILCHCALKVSLRVVQNSLVVVLLLLLSPVLVELVDFNSCIALLKQVKSLCDKEHTFFYLNMHHRESESERDREMGEKK